MACRHWDIPNVTPCQRWKAVEVTDTRRGHGGPEKLRGMFAKWCSLFFSLLRCVEIHCVLTIVTSWFVDIIIIVIPLAMWCPEGSQVFGTCSWETS